MSLWAQSTQCRRCAMAPFIAFWSPINKLLMFSQRRTLRHQLASYTVMMSRPCQAVRGPKVSQPRVHLHPMSRVWHRCKALQDCAVCSPLSTSVGSLNALPAVRSKNFPLAAHALSHWIGFVWIHQNWCWSDDIFYLVFCLQLNCRFIY